MTGDVKEFRVLLTPQRTESGSVPKWAVRLQNCPIPEEIGDKGLTTSKLNKEVLAKLRSETFMESEQLLREAGQKVWDSLMIPDLRASFNSCHRQVVEMAHGTLRVVIVPFAADSAPVTPPDMVNLAELPFELLRRPDNSMLTHFVATNSSTPISRGLADTATLPSHGLTGPLRILVVISDPKGDFPPIAAAAEKAAIERAVAEHVESGQIKIEFCDPPTLEELHRRVKASRFHVLHFAGHGGIEIDVEGNPSAYLAFVDRNSANDSAPRVHKVTPETLVTNLNSASDLKLVVLTSCVSAQASSSQKCFDSVAHYLMTNSKMAAVVAMQFDLESDAAEAFSRIFYAGLSAMPIDVLVTEARIQMTQGGRFSLGHRAWANPMVLWRSENGQVFHRTCGLSDDAQAEITSINVLIDENRKMLLDLLAELRQMDKEVRTRLSRLREKLEQSLSDRVKRHAELLGETIRLVPVGASPGKEAICRLVLRFRQKTKLQSFRLKVRIPKADLKYLEVVSASRSISVSQIGDDIQIVYLDPSSDEWLPNKEHELGQLKFQIIDGRPPSIVDLTFPEAPEVVSPQETCFNGLGGLVFVEFPDS